MIIKYILFGLVICVILLCILFKDNIKKFIDETDLHENDCWLVIDEVKSNNKGSWIETTIKEVLSWN